MKKLVTLILALLPLLSKAQSSEPITFTEVVKVDSADHTELFNRARSWFNEKFRSSKDVLNITDKETGELSGKGLTQFSSKNFVGSAGVKGVIRFLVTIQAKDGRYKYRITDFTHESTAVGVYTYDFGVITNDEICPYKIPGTTKKWQNRIWIELQEKTRVEGEALVMSLKEAMNKPSFNNDKW